MFDRNDADGPVTPTGTSSRWAGDGSALTVRVLVAELVRRAYPPGPLLARVGLTPRDIDNPFGRVPRDLIFAFAELAAATTRDPAFHLHATARAEIGAFGAADFVVTMAPTVGIGFSRVAAGFSVINSGLRMVPVVGTHDAFLRLSTPFESMPHPVDVETVAVAAATRSRRAMRGVGPTLVTRTGPDLGYRATFEGLVGCQVRYDAPEDRIVFTRATWDARPATAHPAFSALFSFVAEPVIARLVPEMSLVASVECIIEERLADGGLAASQVADILGISARTLYRRLANEGCRFGDVLDAVRLRVAQRELAAGHAVGDIALRLGFSEPSAFTRAYRRWTGVAPSNHRT